MKRFYLSLAFSIFACQIQAQVGESEVPASVINEFKREYPLEKGISWEKKGENYAANFEDGALHYSALYSSAGTMLYLITEITEYNLPLGIRIYLNKNYPDRIITQGKKITFADEAISYSIDIDNITLFFDEQEHLIGERMNG
jgi:hypothetical protein